MGRLNESRISAALTEDFAVGSSLAMRSTAHAQHYTTVFVGVDADVTVRLAGGQMTRGRAVVVGPDVWHEAECPGVAVSLLYDPERMVRRGDALDGRLAARLREAVASLRGSLTDAAVLIDFARESARLLEGGAPARALDRRVARALEALRDPEQPIPELRISPAHLQALFARDVGLPMRSYRLWRRLLRALAVFPQTDATYAAHLAGFADLAHFSRTCRRMLGYSPTALREQLRVR